MFDAKFSAWMGKQYLECVCSVVLSVVSLLIVAVVAAEVSGRTASFPAWLVILVAVAWKLALFRESKSE
jgi:hypothetical protein